MKMFKMSEGDLMNSFEYYKDRIVYDLMPSIEKETGIMFEKLYEREPRSYYNAIKDNNLQKLLYLNNFLCKEIDRMKSNEGSV
jgi:hypothetical protein